MAGMTQAPDGTVQLLEQLFGPALDVELVLKSMPDQADVSIPNGKLRRNVERTSNAVGITAGALGLAAALKDPRLGAKGAGKVARALHATGQKMPEISSRVANPKVAGALAAGAVGTQVANLGGDALIAGTLGKKPAKQRRVVASKRGVTLHPEIKTLSRKVVEFWKPPVAPPAAPAAAAGAQPGTRKAVKDSRKVQAGLAQQATDQRRAKAVGSDVGVMMGTKSGKIAAGTLAATGANKATGGRNRGYEYAPDYYAKADRDIEFRGEFTKFDDAKRQAFGWASVVTKDGSPVLDRQGDYISIEDLETAAYTYVHKSRVGGDMHRRNGDAPHHVSDMIESMVFTPEKITKMGLPAGFPEGWWVGYQIHDEDTWQEVRKRGRTGFSIHGRGIRRDVDIDDLMGVTQ